MARVSILTALYNHEKYVVRAIESVLAQTYQDWEHLIWDDGSSDKSLEIARSYETKYPGKIKVFTHAGGVNKGQERTRNALVKKATGEYLCLLDSDDEYHPEKLELLVPMLSDPKVGLVYGRFEIFFEALGKKIEWKPGRQPRGQVLPDLLEGNFIGAGAVLFRRASFKRNRFDTSFRTMGEYPLWVAIARDWEVAHVPKVVALWRDHGVNLGTKLAVQAKAELVVFLERLQRDPAYAEHDRVIARALACRRYDYASELFTALDFRGARRQAMKVVSDSWAPHVVRAKAALVLASTFFGSRVGRRLAGIKRGIWERRHEIAVMTRDARGIQNEG